MKKIHNITSIAILVVLIMLVLIYGKSLLIPFILAWLLWFVVRQLRKQLDSVRIMREYIPRWIKNTIVLVFLLFIVHMLFAMVMTKISAIISSFPLYQQNLSLLLQNIQVTFGLDVMNTVQVYVADFDIAGFFLAVFNYSTDFVSNTFMILLYALFIFLEEASFKEKVYALFVQKEHREQANAIMHNVEKSVAKYLGMKAFISFITAVLSFIILKIIGVDSAIFWVVLIFILNFIPTIGSLIATIFPAVFSLLQFGDVFHGVLVLLSVGVVQIVVGNIVEPRIMGNSMNVSPLATIVFLSFWGAIWGITGMILSVPILVVLVIVLSQFPKTKPFAVMLSGDGRVDASHSPM